MQNWLIPPIVIPVGIVIAILALSLIRAFG